MVDQAVLTAFNTLLTSYLAKKFNLDNLSFTALSTISSYLITTIASHNYVNQFDFLSKIDRTILICVIIVIVGICMFIFKNKLYIFIKKLTFRQHFILEIQSDRSIKIFTDYTTKYQDMFDLPISYVLTSDNYKRPANNIIVDFNDTNLGLKGYYMVSLVTTHDFKSNADNTDNSNNPNNINTKYVFYVFLEKHKTINTLNYIDTIEKYITKPMELYSVKTFEYTTNSVRYVVHPSYKIYSGDIMSKEYVNELFIKPLFHPQKNDLWKQIQHVNNKTNIIASQAGFILHGPPGTGKSRFAYCMAMATGRHLISIDMLSFRKSRLHELFKNPEVNAKKYQPEDVIFVFDEFDIIIQTLHEKEINDKRALVSNQKKFEEYEKKWNFIMNH